MIMRRRCEMGADGCLGFEKDGKGYVVNDGEIQGKLDESSMICFEVLILLLQTCDYAFCGV